MLDVVKTGVRSVVACAVLGLSANASASTVDLAGDFTAVELISFELLNGLGLSVGPTGLATVDNSGSNPIFTFPVTGGTLDTVTGAALIEHDGSGLSITDGADTLTLENFFIDTDAGEMYGDVGINGTDAGNALLFTLSGSNTLLLSQPAADVLNDLFDTKLKKREKFGRATIKLTPVPVPAALPLLLSAIVGLGFLSRRRG